MPKQKHQRLPVLTTIYDTRIKSSFIPLFGDIKYDDDTVRAFVDVNKIGVETCVVCVLQQKSDRH